MVALLWSRHLLPLRAMCGVMHMGVQVCWLVPVVHYARMCVCCCCMAMPALKRGGGLCVVVWSVCVPQAGLRLVVYQHVSLCAHVVVGLRAGAGNSGVIWRHEGLCRCS